MHKNPESNTKKILDMYKRYEFPDELADEVKQWLVSDFHAEEKEEIIHQIWDDLPHIYDIKEEYALEEIKASIGIRDNSPFYLRRTFIRSTVAAAALLIIVTTGWLKYLNLQPLEREEPLLTTTISTGELETKHAELIEHTQAWVNSRTVLSYVEPSEVELNGEAFFDVEKKRGLIFR